MLKNILKGNAEKIKTLKPVKYNSEKDAFEYNVRGFVEVNAFKGGEKIYHDEGDNHVTFWAKQALINLMRENSYSANGDTYQGIASNADSTDTDRGKKISQRSRENAGHHDGIINIDGTLVSGSPFFFANDNSSYPGFFFNGGAGTADSSPGSLAVEDYIYPYFPTKILLGTGVEFTRYGIVPDINNVSSTTRSSSAIETKIDAVVAATFDGSTEHLTALATVEYAGFAGEVGVDPELNYGSDFFTTNFLAGSSAFSLEDGLNSLFFNKNIDDTMNWYSATWDPESQALLQTRSVPHLISGNFIPFTDDIYGLTAYNYDEGVATYPSISANFRIRKELPHNNSFGVSGAIKTSVIRQDDGDYYNDVDAGEAITTPQDIEGVQYPVDITEYKGIGRPCFVYFKRDEIEITKGDLDSNGDTPDLINSSIDTSIETKITFKAELPEQQQGEYYPYNGWLLKEIGLFSDAKYNILEQTDGGAETTLESIETYKKMPGGIMIAKRNIAPIFKHGNVAIEIRWTLYF